MLNRQVSGLSLDSIRQQLHTGLHESGFVHIENAGIAALKPVLDELGEVIQVTEVRIDRKTQALVTSDKKLNYHSDHSQADYVVWICLQPAKCGGASILSDALKAYGKLTAEEQLELQKVRCFEHKVFPDDPDSQPMVSSEDGRLKFYCTFWLLEENLPAAQMRVLEKFRQHIHNSVLPDLTLDSGDILVVDNKRILHGRRAFTDDNRHLRRFWIKK